MNCANTKIFQTVKNIWLVADCWPDGDFLNVFATACKYFEGSAPEYVVPMAAAPDRSILLSDIYLLTTQFNALLLYGLTTHCLQIDAQESLSMLEIVLWKALTM